MKRRKALDEAVDAIADDDEPTVVAVEALAGASPASSRAVPPGRNRGGEQWPSAPPPPRTRVPDAAPDFGTLQTSDDVAGERAATAAPRDDAQRGPLTASAQPAGTAPAPLSAVDALCLQYRMALAAKPGPDAGPTAHDRRVVACLRTMDALLTETLAGAHMRAAQCSVADAARHAADLVARLGLTPIDEAALCGSGRDASRERELQQRLRTASAFRTQL
jgi:hypothetical protein